jgi:hypothetical protein
VVNLRASLNPLVAIINIGMILRLSVAVWNGFFGPSYGADLDAVSFHLLAVDYSKNLSDMELKIGWIYSCFLGILYFITTESLFVGSLASCVAWFFSANFLLKSMNFLSISKEIKLKIFFIYSFLPSSLMLTSVTLREPFQLMFVNMAACAVIGIYVKRKFSYWFVLLFACLGMGLLHGALLMFSIYIVASAFYFFKRRKLAGVNFWRIVKISPIMFLFLYFAFQLFSSVAYQLNEGLGSAIEAYQLAGIGSDGRSQYKLDVEINGYFGLIFFIPIALFQYLFEPMPWRVSTILDVVVLMENILRLWLICKAFWVVGNIPVNKKPIFLFFLTAYFSIEVFWSVGTVNWGTAIRHHLPGMGLLLLAAFSFSRPKCRSDANIRSGR